MWFVSEAVHRKRLNRATGDGTFEICAVIFRRPCPEVLERLKIRISFAFRVKNS